MNRREKTICFTGHRSEKMPQGLDAQEALGRALGEAIEDAIKDGVDTFITGVCYGFDLMAATQVLYHKKRIKSNDGGELKLIAVVPFVGQAKRWNVQTRTRYDTILTQCDEVVTLNVDYKKGCYYQRNRWMVQNSGRVIAYYDGSGGGTGYTVAYARKAKLSVINLYDRI